MAHLLSRKKRKRIVLFLCTGDTCRGPMAQGYMKHVLKEQNIKDVEVRTAGVMTIPGLIPTAEAVQVMKGAEIDITMHRSTPLSPELLRKADLVLGMSPFHVQFATREDLEIKEKTFLLKEFAQSDVKNYQITDPMGATLEVYKRVFREMKLAIDKMVETKQFFTGVEEGKAAPPPAPAPVKKGRSRSASSKPASASTGNAKSPSGGSKKTAPTGAKKKATSSKTTMKK